MADKLTIQIDGNIKNYQDSLKEIAGQTKNLEDQLSSIAKKSAVAFAGLTAAVVGSVAAYRVQEQAEARTRQTIKATGNAAGISANEIFKMASALQEVTTFGDEAIIGGQNLLLTFKNIGRETFPRATEAMLDMATAMKIDLKSASIQVGKALNDPATGLSMLTRVGITFTDQQKDMIKTMQKAGDLAGAQAVILKELESQFGGTSRAAAEGTGQFIQLQNIIGDLIEDFGKQFVPILVDGTKQLKAFFLQIREQEELISMAAKITGIGIAITGTVTAVAAAGVVILKLSAIIGGLSAVFLPATVAASSFWVAVTGPIGIAVAGIGLVVAGVTALWSALDKKDGAGQLKEVNDELAKQEMALKTIDSFMAKSSRNANAHNKQRRAGIVLEIERLKELRGEIQGNGDLEGELDRLAAKAFEDKRSRLKDEADATADEKQNEFDNALEKFNENQELLTEAELLKIQERQELKKEQDAIAKAEELESKGKHDQALALLDDFRIKKQIKDSKKSMADAKKFAALEKQLAINTSNAKIGIVAKTGQLINAIAGEETKAGFALAQIAAVAQVLIADGQARATATAASASASLAAVPGTNLAVFAANMATYSGLITANTGLSLGIIGAQTIQGFANGGPISGGIPGIDSVPIMAQRGELIVPEKSFDDVVNSAAANLNGGGQMNLVVSYDSEEASQIVTVRQNEDSALGISQDSFKEAV